MRTLSPIEEQRLIILTSNSVGVSLIEPTLTGLKKSILDATTSIQNHLLENNIHDYRNQKQGPNHKVMLSTNLLTENIIIPSRASMYRPITKKGDPRIWFKNLTNYASPNDILALIIFKSEINIINLTQTPLVEIIQQNHSGPILDLLNQINNNATEVSLELLNKIKTIAQSGPTKSVMQTRADTAIGRTLETM